MKRTFILALFLMVPMAAFAQLSPSATWTAQIPTQYRVIPNVTYLTASNVDLKLDVYQRLGPTTPQPTLIFMHGGFWSVGSKEQSVLSLMPWLDMGWNVVNVEYRLARVALAPAAVEDCLCALKFVASRAMMYNVDVNKIVVSGESAGGHLALSLGMIPDTAGLDRECAGNTPLPKVAAVVNWFGVTDVYDVVQGPHAANAAVQWMGGMTNREEIARRVSPLTYVRSGLPPIITIHGDKDQAVPYPQAVQLHEALTKAGVTNRLITVPNGRHGQFTAEERTKIWGTIREFLSKNGL